MELESDDQDNFVSKVISDSIDRIDAYEKLKSLGIEDAEILKIIQNIFESD